MTNKRPQQQQGHAISMAGRGVMGRNIVLNMADLSCAVAGYDKGVGFVHRGDQQRRGEGAQRVGGPTLARIATEEELKPEYANQKSQCLSCNNRCTLLQARWPDGEARATSIRWICEERATKPAGLQAAARMGATAGGHLLRCRSSTMHTGIACVAAPRICPPGARAKVHRLLHDRP